MVDKPLMNAMSTMFKRNATVKGRQHLGQGPSQHDGPRQGQTTSWSSNLLDKNTNAAR